MNSTNELAEVRIKGRNTLVPLLTVNGQRIIVAGRWIKVGRVEDEDWQEGQVVRDPQRTIEAILRADDVGIDLFTFCQKLPDTQPRYDYPLVWENLAVVRTGSFDAWWKELPQVTRKNIRRATRRAVVVRVVPCDDTLVEGITAIYNEIPIRDGRPFPHYGKDFDMIRREVSTMADRSEFLAAYHDQELIGFIKLVHMGKLSAILHIVSKRAHYDKRPANALLAKAVEVCHERGTDFLIYGQYNYGNRSNSPLTEFKRRNGFERVLVPRYIVPLNAWGRLSLRLGLHRGITGMLPRWCLDRMLDLRARYYEKRLQKFLSGTGSSSAIPQQDNDD